MHGSFDEHYSQWISTPTSSSILLPQPHLSAVSQQSPLLFSTACLLAARFHTYPHSLPKSVGHEMYLLVRRLAAAVVLKPPPLRYNEVQALLLLAMFSPTVQTAMPIDSWLMSAIAISHVTLHIGMGKSGGGNSLVNMGRDETRHDADHDRGGSDQRIQTLRLWNHLCLTHIQYISPPKLYVQSFQRPLTWCRFSIGNGRQSMVQQKFIDHCTGLLQLQSLRINSRIDSYVGDCRLVAEVMLYWKTAQLLKDVQVQQPDPSGECKIAISLPALTTDCGDEELVFTELAAWRAEWGYLLGQLALGDIDT